MEVIRCREMECNYRNKDIEILSGWVTNCLMQFSGDKCIWEVWKNPKFAYKTEDFGLLQSQNEVLRWILLAQCSGATAEKERKEKKIKNEWLGND